MINKKIILFILVIASFWFANDAISCVPNWQCGFWSNCVENQQFRPCVDFNNCSVFTDMPVVMQSCTGYKDCTPDWELGIWSTCVGNVKIGSYFDKNICGVTTGKPADQIQYCTASSDCIDLDNGKNYFIKGILSYQGLTFTDYCYDKDSKYLAEYYCNGNFNEIGKVEWKFCENGCENGACKDINLSNICVDSDSGISYVIENSELNFNTCQLFLANLAK